MFRKTALLGLLTVSLIMTGFAGRDPASYSDSDLAQMYAARGQNERALHHFGKAIAAAPDSPAPYLARTFFLLKLERRAEAMADLERVIALQPDRAQHYMTRGMIYTNAGDKERAERDFAQACRLGDQSGCLFMSGDK